MESRATGKFWKAFEKLPANIREIAKKNFTLWKENSFHPSLEFKQVNAIKLVYSVRIGLDWRALGVKENNTVTWFWIGSHSDYDKLLDSF